MEQEEKENSGDKDNNKQQHYQKLKHQLKHLPIHQLQQIPQQIHQHKVFLQLAHLQIS